MNMAYINNDFIFKTIIPNKKNKSDIQIICCVKNEKEATVVKKEIKKAIRRMNHLLKKKTRLEIKITSDEFD